MTLEEAQYSYQAWRGQLDAGLIRPDQFRAAVSQIQATDATGTPWMVDPESGIWLRWNGASWEPGQTYGYQPPPAAASPPPAYPPAPPPGTVAYGYPQASPYAEQVMPAQAQPQKTPWSQRIWDILSVAGSSVMAGAWYWYSSLDPYVKPDYKTCAAMVLLPILLIVFREKIDGWLLPLQSLREKMPRMVLLGVGAATPLLVSNFLYASGNSNYPYMLRTYLISTIVSYVILRQPPRGMGGLSTSRMGGQI